MLVKAQTFLSLAVSTVVAPLIATGAFVQQQTFVDSAAKSRLEPTLTDAATQRAAGYFSLYSLPALWLAS